VTQHEPSSPLRNFKKKWKSWFEALQQAWIDIITVRRAAHLSAHPYYWAGFTLSGDAGPP